ncbi:hypothetical protein K402DRAFT_394751 [Aulographum hederae CBS 113979]|uniref:Uncharacterized protein n=1 Tax=Aulographum hederae CBS 113979 TaxID=1176131 RepID=A0A6G1GWT3_9PEZI|nr:hypothetical protein K402DRAFT_394751 [Aulographum hederae CBS 113979]
MCLFETKKRAPYVYEAPRHRSYYTSVPGGTARVASVPRRSYDYDIVRTSTHSHRHPHRHHHHHHHHPRIIEEKKTRIIRT